MRKSIDRLLEMKHLPFLGLNSQGLGNYREKLDRKAAIYSPQKI